jgi:hypothetical protein
MIENNAKLAEYKLMMRKVPEEYLVKNVKNNLIKARET